MRVSHKPGATQRLAPRLPSAGRLGDESKRLRKVNLRTISDVWRLMCMIGVGAASAPWILRADYPVISHRYAADPAALVHEGRLYLYASHDEDNTTNSYSMRSIVCFSTTDLKNWTDHGVVFDATQDTRWASLAWAPSVVHRDGVFYLYFANGGGSIGVATSGVPTGPFRDARGSALVHAGTPGAATPTQWYFDPCVFVDDDGQAYLYFGGQFPTNSRVIRLNRNMISTTGSALPLNTPDFFEALHLHKHQGLYYLSYSTRPESGMVIAYAVSTNPMTGFQYRGTILPNPPQNRWNNNHHAIVAYQRRWWIAYHNRAVSLASGLTGELGIYRRNLCLDELFHEPDGTIRAVTPTVDGLAQLRPMNPYERVEAETIGGQSGIRTAVCDEGGLMAVATTNGAWIRIRGVDFAAGATAFTARVACGGPGSLLDLRLDSPSGFLMGAVAVPNTGGWQSWRTVTTPVTNVSGVRDLYLRFTGSGAPLLHMNWWQFQPAGPTATAWPVTVEAESGDLGSDWQTRSEAGTTWITISSNSTGQHPGRPERVATYTVTFPAPGTYELYARIRVGPGAWADDSFFYGNGFGLKSPTEGGDWITVNGLASAGFAQPGEVVQGRGVAGTGLWKWVNLSQYVDSSSEPPLSFVVSAESLTRIFQIGGREDGLEIDKLVFAPAGYWFTVADLDVGRSGQLPRISVRIRPEETYQVIEGLGGALCFYNGWIRAHP